MSETFRAPLWASQSMGTWVFVTLPESNSESIRSIPRPPAPGFGSVRVRATVGDTTWSTSIFPDAKSGCYVLPVKKAVRRAEGVEVGDLVEVVLEVVE